MIKNMKAIVDTLRRHPNKRYTLAEIETENLIPWARNGRTIRKMIEADRKGANVLKAEITGSASQRRYLILGRNIKSYLQTYGPALMGMARKPKRKHNVKRSKVGDDSSPKKRAH